MSISKRDQLVRAAWRVIAERGVDGMRVEDVTAAVNVSNSLAYYHFETRAKLLAATIDYNEGLAPSPVDMPALGNALERLEAAVAGRLEQRKENPRQQHCLE